MNRLIRQGSKFTKISGSGGGGAGWGGSTCPISPEFLNPFTVSNRETEPLLLPSRRKEGFVLRDAALLVVLLLPCIVSVQC